MSHLISKISSIKGCFYCTAINEIAPNIFKFQLEVTNSYTYVYASTNKVNNIKVGSKLLVKLCIANYIDNRVLKDNYPILLIESILNSGTADIKDIKKNIDEISNNNIKKINACIDLNNEYLLNVIKDFDEYSKQDNIKEKINKFLNDIKVATFNKVNFLENEEENSIDVNYKKDGDKKEHTIFSILFDETFTVLEYRNTLLFFETEDKFEICKLINKIFKHFNIHLDKTIDLELRFIEIFVPKLFELDKEKAKQTYDKEANKLTNKHKQNQNLLKDKCILIIGRGVFEQNKTLIYEITREYGFIDKNVTIVNENNKIISRGLDYLEKVKNNYYSGVIIGQTPHSSTGKKEANSLLDEIYNAANKKYCYVHIADKVTGNIKDKQRLSLSKARLKDGLDKIVANITH